MINIFFIFGSNFEKNEKPRQLTSFKKLKELIKTFKAFIDINVAFCHVNKSTAFKGKERLFMLKNSFFVNIQSNW